MKSKLSRSGLNRILGLSLIVIGILVLIYLRVYYEIQKEEIGSWTNDTVADCALVLTGGPQRVREGYAMLARNQVRHLIISGVNPTTELKDLTGPWDLFWGPSRDKIILEKRSSTTYGNAQQSLPIVEGLGCQKVALVTSALHMWRAYRTIRGSYPESISIVKHAVPNSARSSSHSEFWSEVLKSMFYSLWAF